MNLEKFLNEDVSIVGAAGTPRVRVRALIQGDEVLTTDVEKVVMPGFTVERALPSGQLEVFDILEVQFVQRLASVPAHYRIHISSRTSRRTSGSPSTVTNISAANVSVGSITGPGVVHSTAPDLDAILRRLRSAIEAQVSEASARHELITAVERMRNATEPGGLRAAYRAFVACAADHMTVVAPFVPALGQIVLQ